MLSEVWTMIDPRNLAGLVKLGAVAERAGADGVLIGEHIVLAENSARDGLPENPREWLGVGFQNSATALDLALYAARSYSLMRPPRTGRRWIRDLERSATG
jgi:hypothetical protein